MLAAHSVVSSHLISVGNFKLLVNVVPQLKPGHTCCAAGSRLCCLILLCEPLFLIYTRDSLRWGGGVNGHWHQVWLHIWETEARRP